MDGAFFGPSPPHQKERRGLGAGARGKAVAGLSVDEGEGEVTLRAGARWKRRTRISVRGAHHAAAWWCGGSCVSDSLSDSARWHRAWRHARAVAGWSLRSPYRSLNPCGAAARTGSRAQEVGLRPASRGIGKTDDPVHASSSAPRSARERRSRLHVEVHDELRGGLALRVVGGDTVKLLAHLRQPDGGG